jgi:hypothetical protein
MEEAETVDHVLWGCEFAQKVWKASAVKLPAIYATNLSFVDLLACFSKIYSSPWWRFLSQRRGHYGKQEMRCFGKIKW